MKKFARMKLIINLIETVNSKNECLELKQEKLHTFHILEEGILNTLSCFIFLDLSISEKQISKDDDEEDDDYLLFPYGDESLSHVRPSRYIDTLVYPYSRRCAENWMNLAIVLPQPVSVSPGIIYTIIFSRIFTLNSKNCVHLFPSLNEIKFATTLFMIYLLIF